MGRSGAAPAFRFLNAPSLLAAELAASLAEDDIRGNEAFETAVVFDASGREVWRMDGEQLAVDLTDAYNRGVLKDAVLTHNHPAASGQDPAYNSLSDMDWHAAIRADMAEMRAVTPVATFSIKRPDGGWPDAAQVVAYYNKRHAAKQDAADRRVLARPYNPNKRVSQILAEEMRTALHDTNRDVARRFGVTYTRTTRRT